MEFFLIFVLIGAIAAQEPSSLEDSVESLSPSSSHSGAILRSFDNAPVAPTGRKVQVNALEDPVVAILKNVLHMPDAEGVHSFDFEAGNGIKFQFSGSEGVNGGAYMQGVYSYPMEDGSLAEVTFVADENGYQPDSALLPVAPAFPHPIPQYVLDQIEFARLQEESRAREGGLKASK
ncbi:cuticle protein AM1239-like [Macrobrachium rosenbergii]|uniref:cuticle protein AM1239-like n=1 Tax=Macrobrachium rosenbergii TaxID=79674 RepID=UPI0034D5582D